MTTFSLVAPPIRVFSRILKARPSNRGQTSALPSVAILVVLSDWQQAYIAAPDNKFDISTVFQ